MGSNRDKSQEPSATEIRDLALDLIHSTSAMTLATTNGRDAWAAPVYYVLYKSAFYFFSNPDSRHIRDAAAPGDAAAAIHAEADTWQDIRGIQMAGRIESVSVGLEAARVIRAYLKRFPFTKEFFKPGDDFDLDAFSKRFRVRLYRFAPTLVYYQDNHIKFGFREEVDI